MSEHTASGEEVERLRLAVRLAQQVGNAYRGDWAYFDGRQLRNEMDDLSRVVTGDIAGRAYRILHGLCPHGGGHWRNYCWDYGCDDEAEGPEFGRTGEAS